MYRARYPKDRITLQLVPSHFVMKQQTDLPRKEENVSNKTIKSHTFRKSEQSKLLEEIRVMLKMVITISSKAKGMGHNFSFS